MENYANQITLHRNPNVKSSKAFYRTETGNNRSVSWVSKMVIPVYGVSEGEALCDWIY